MKFTGFWITCLLLCLLFWGVIGYVIFHFLMKVW